MRAAAEAEEGGSQGETLTAAAGTERPGEKVEVPDVSGLNRVSFRSDLKLIQVVHILRKVAGVCRKRHPRIHLNGSIDQPLIQVPTHCRS